MGSNILSESLKIMYNPTFDLQGKSLARTYRQILQTDTSGSFYNGYGNIITITGSSNLSSSYAVTASNANTSSYALASAIQLPAITENMLNGFIGLLNTNPQHHLDVNGGIGDTIGNDNYYLGPTDAVASWVCSNFGNFGVGTKTPTNMMTVAGVIDDISGSNYYFDFYQLPFNPTPHSFINGHGGFFGVANRIPNYTLDVSGNINTNVGYLLNGLPYSPNSASWASQSLSASWAPVGGSSVSASWSSASIFSISASFASQSISTSWSPFIPTISASWASSSISSSYSITASFALNGGGGVTSISQSNLLGTASLFSQGFINTGSYTSKITASFNLTTNENGKLLIVNFPSNSFIQVSSTLPQGFGCSLYQSGSGQVIVTGSGANIRNRAGLSASYAQYSIISLLQIDSGNYVLQGDMA